MAMAMAMATPPRADRPGLRRIGAALGVAAMGVVGTLLSYSFATTRSDPSRALAAWPWNATARAELAAKAITADTAPGTARKARALARAALGEQALLAVAGRTLGVSEALLDRPADAAKAMAYAEALSRRDLPTQLWLIEDRVGAGDVGGAIIHYDRALRTADSAPDLLFPILVPAAADVTVAAPLARRLATRPLWWRPYLTALVQQNPSDATTALLVRAVKLDPAKSDERTLLIAAMTRLADAGRFDLARSLAPRGSASGMLRNGSFEEEAGLPPFDWTLVDDGDLSGVIEARDDGAGNALYLTARNGRGGEVARQVLTLAPGRYRLRGKAGDAGTGQDRPAVTMTCANSGDALAPATLSSGAFATEFTVPEGCAGQRLSVLGNAALDGQDRRTWLDDMKIERLQ